VLGLTNTVSPVPAASTATILSGITVLAQPFPRARQAKMSSTVPITTPVVALFSDEENLNDVWLDQPGGGSRTCIVCYNAFNGA